MNKGLFILILIAAAGAGLYFYYTNCEKAFLAECAKLPKFDEDAVRESITAKYSKKNGAAEGTSSISKEEFSKMWEEALNKKLAEEFPPKKLSESIMKAMKKYEMVKKDNQVTFQIEPKSETITGTFLGMTQDNKITVSSNGVKKSYPLSQIIPAFHYLFVERISEKQQEEAIKAVKKNFEERKSAYVEKIRPELEAELSAKYAQPRTSLIFLMGTCFFNKAIISNSGFSPMP